jgi:hypothetical protein
LGSFILARLAHVYLSTPPEPATLFRTAAVMADFVDADHVEAYAIALWLGKNTWDSQRVPTSSPARERGSTGSVCPRNSRCGPHVGSVGPVPSLSLLAAVPALCDYRTSMPAKARRTSGLVLILAAELAAPRMVLAQGKPELNPSSSPWARPAVAASPSVPPGSLAPRLTQPQFDAFVQMTGDHPYLVHQRLTLDPGLSPLVAAAADARSARQASGKAMVTGGYVILVVGGLLGGILFLSAITPSSDCPWEGGSDCDSGGNDGQVHAGLGILALSGVAGLVLVIAGNVKRSGTGQPELDALTRYHGSGPPLASPRSAEARPVRSREPGRSLAFPLLALSF